MSISVTNAKVLKARRRTSRSAFGHRKLVFRCKLCGGPKRYKSPDARCGSCKHLLSLGGDFAQNLAGWLDNTLVSRQRKFRSRKFAQPLPAKQYKSVFEVNKDERD